MQTAEATFAPGIQSGPVDSEGIPITWDQIESFLKNLPDRGRTEDTVKAYRRSLTKFYQELPADKRITQNSLARWREALLGQGYTARTVNASLSSVNSLFEYLGLRGYKQLRYLKPPEDTQQPELTRNEYLRLLSTARLLKKERMIEEETESKEV